ncbi:MULTISPECIES: hypothetical protein [Pseudofrankia]|uniref:hypothetical protein n=1 Tax=Pseudofrankia TaxID=2994363 RepID=UPI000234B57F|nr:MULTISPECIES: hypothetical protein [Pseudofrankia]OHV35174.1 hypothetical protein BCD49_04110 [Pseudofrankia sp. EUN1h]
MKRRLLAAATAATLTAGIAATTIVGTAGTASARPLTCELLEPLYMVVLDMIVPPAPGTGWYAVMGAYQDNC